MTDIVYATDAVFTEPMSPVVEPEVAGGAEESFSIEISGLGQLTGLSYTVPAHTSGWISAKLQISALSSSDVANLNDLAVSMMDSSHREQVRDESKTSVQAELSLWATIFGGSGASASYEDTYSAMSSTGLTDDQITILMEAFLERAKTMSTVEIKFYVNNTNNDYSVSGDLYLYTVSGKVKTSKGTHQYRMLADSAAAGGPPATGGGAPSSGDIVKL